MYLIRKLWITTALALAALNASAASRFDPITQSYFIEETERIGGIEIQRMYSSVSSFRGHFGYGWCSDLDARIIRYSNGETRYRGCDPSSAEMIDPRTDLRSASRLVPTGTGFKRQREDGATQKFDHKGLLASVTLVGGRELQIERESGGQVRALRSGATLVQIEMETDQVDLSLAKVLDLGREKMFRYRDGLLIATTDDRYTYDDDRNVIRRERNGDVESVYYDSENDRVTRIGWSALSGERLLLTLERKEKSAEIEIRAELERGAEMHPVRILYGLDTRRLDLVGDRRTARRILQWLKT